MMASTVQTLAEGVEVDAPTETGKGVRRRLSPDERRSEILDAARAVFSETGLTGTTMRDVAERADITETHLYRYFRKEELFERAVLEPLEELEARVARETTELAERPGISRPELLEHYHELCVGYFLQLAPLLRAGVLPRQPGEPSFRPQALVPRWWAVVEGVIGEVTGWKGRSLNLDVMADALLGLYVLVGLDSSLDTKPIEPRQAARHLTRMFAPGRLDARERAALSRAAKRARGASSHTERPKVASAPTPEDGRRRLTKAQRRESILLAARGLFTEVGIAGARSKDIAERAGITETFLYRHFGSKEEMYAAAIEAPAEEALRELAETTAELARDRSRIDFLLEFNRAALEMFIDNSDVLASALLSDVARSRSFYRDRVLPHFRVIGDVVYEQMGYSGDKVDRRIARIAILGSQWGVAMDYQSRFAEAGVAELAVQLTRLLTLGVLPMPDRGS